MSDSLVDYLHADHARIDALLDASVRDPERFDHEAFERFRAALLRHVGIEEKILLPYARDRRGGHPLPIAAILRREHGAIASLLVPTPDHALVRELRALLDIHNPREEGPGGFYEACEQLAAAESAALLERARSAPEVPMARHYDGARATRTAEEAIRRSAASAAPRAFVNGKTTT